MNLYPTRSLTEDRLREYQLTALAILKVLLLTVLARKYLSIDRLSPTLSI